jgi:large subunit ribosomal protein L24
MHKMANIKKNDTVEIITGKDKGKRGRVMEVLPEEQKVVVEGVNVYKKHQKPTVTNQEGGIVEKNMPIHISNVCFVDPKTQEKSSVKRKTLENGKRVRYSRKSGEILD